tara:strand:+ start:2250 stop:2423 length:174 start_codon:yes stop_codon:yes gene_type:complete
MFGITIHHIAENEFDVSVVKDRETDESLVFQFDKIETANDFSRQLRHLLTEFNVQTS